MKMQGSSTAGARNEGFSLYEARILTACIVIAGAVALAGALFTTAPAYADEPSLAATTLATAAADDNAETEIALSGVPYNGDYGIYGVPGEKLTITAQAKTGPDYWSLKVVKGATFKWTPNKKLKATVKGNKLIIKKLPKAGNYKFKVTAFDKSGAKLLTKTYTISVKKKPAVKVIMQLRGESGELVSSNASKVAVDSTMSLNLKGASFGWDNNNRKKKPFYVWKVKNVTTGESATWNWKEGVFKANAIIGGGSVAGGGSPFFMGTFNQQGTYKITGTVYHSNKKIATATKTVKVY